jgi:Uncharacterized membrane protein (homolog of Drosophila rhomboid)
MPKITLALIAVTLGVYIAGNPMQLALWPVGSPQFHWWQTLSYAFVHGGLLHLIVNMLALVSFGPALERAWGKWRFLACYATAAVIGGLAQGLTVQQPIVGASAALFGLFAAYVVGKPKARIVTLFPWPLPAYVVLAAYALLSVLAALFDWLHGIAHIAHLYGMTVGVAFATNNKPRR